MKKLAFEAKNSQDFEAITIAITSALVKIEKDPKLSSTQACLAKLSKVHRNTIMNRAKDNKTLEGGLGWPLSELERIKSQRAAETLSTAALIKSDKELITELQNQLQGARVRAGHWFHRTLDLKRDIHDLKIMIERHETRIRLITDENNRLRSLKVIK
ncbi:hypothetical protein N7D90_15760 [Pseudomonas fragi]|uniref:hypothetical protein n=1 Tax=Pseudomonas fragi TaxID=296 RepID=UPI0021C13157|nr:hypothetical protein [Pseudomonas fragi]UXL37040.1 hypothetical protein N7D90_15760 [Pseudomonas fragi]